MRSWRRVVYGGVALLLAGAIAGCGGGTSSVDLSAVPDLAQQPDLAVRDMAGDALIVSDGGTADGADLSLPRDAAILDGAAGG